nr:hypothetical protein [Thermoanaerobaculia bacterium]
FHVAGFVIALAGLAATGNLSSKSFLALAKLLVAIVAGWPMLAAVGWFLVCLFTVEVFHYSLRPLTRSSWALAASILAFGLATWAFPFQVKADQQLGYWQSWWFLTPALAGMVFYQLGVLGHRLNLFAPRSRAVDVAVSLVSLVILVLIFDRNQGPFPQSKLDMPLQGLSAFGHLGWFYTTGIVGSIFLFFVSRVLPAGRWSRFLGENSLVLMCLNSYLLLWIDRPVTAWLYTGLKWQSPLALTLCSAVATLLSFLLVAPLVKAIHRWAPWLTGETPALAPSAAPAVSAGPALAES